MEVPATLAPLWQPSEETVANARITAFRERAERRAGRSLPTYEDLWTWSITDLDGFWGALWDFFGLSEVFGDYQMVLAQERNPGSVWFPDVTVNFTEYVLAQGRAEDVAIVGVVESGEGIELTWEELRRQVAAVAQWLRSRGVARGDRVIGYLPNIPEAVVAMLATAGIGAIWSSVGQDYAPSAVADRLGPLDAKVLVTADSYLHGGRAHDRREAIVEVLGSLPTITDVLVVERLTHGGLPVPGVSPGPNVQTHAWAQVSARQAEGIWERVGFDDPLWVLFSSGTTGRPKGIVQSHGGILLEELKLLGLHLDLGPDDRLFWFTSPSWVMWNIQASALATGASIVCYDGSPTYPDARRLWQLSADCKVTLFRIQPRIPRGIPHDPDRARARPGPVRAASDGHDRGPDQPSHPQVGRLRIRRAAALLR